MTEPLPDTWHTRDLIVLRTTVRLLDETGRPVLDETIRMESGLDETSVRAAIQALLGANHIARPLDRSVARRMSQSFSIGSVSAEGRQKSGAWPSADQMTDRLISALEDLAEYGDDPVTKTRARKALDGLGGFSRDVLVAVVGAAAGTAMQ